MTQKMYDLGSEGIAKNPNQGDFKRVLCVCLGGILRSPTAAWLFGQPPYNFNCRACGTGRYALIRISDLLVNHWAQEIVCMEWQHHKYVVDNFPNKPDVRILVLDIPDVFNFREPELIKLIRVRYEYVTRKET